MSFGGPKKASPGGGLTKETQDLLKGMMKERGLSNRIMGDLMSSVQSGAPLPASAFASSLAKPRPRKRAPVNVPRPKSNRPPPTMPGSFSGKKMHHEILRDCPTEEMRDSHRPAPGRDNEAVKERLALTMEISNLTPEEKEARMAARYAPVPRKPKGPPPKPPTEEEEREAMADAICAEIEEREQFLEDMDKLGRAHLYRDQVKGEVSQRLAQLRKLGVPC